MNAPYTGERPIPEHGTRSRYEHRVLKCRCNDCRRANADYIAEYRNRQQPAQRTDKKAKTP